LTKIVIDTLDKYRINRKLGFSIHHSYYILNSLNIKHLSHMNNGLKIRVSPVLQGPKDRSSPASAARRDGRRHYKKTLLDAGFFCKL
jgi:hypothetical protein